MKKSEWRNGLWVTLSALVLGTLAIAVGLATPGFSQQNVFNFLALVVAVLSVTGIVMALWRIERRSHRLRAPLFWFCLIVNLFLLTAMSIPYFRSPSFLSTHKTDSQTPPSPDNY